MKIFSRFFLFIAIVSCQNQNSIPVDVSVYLTEALNLLERNSVNKNQINWKAFKSDVFKKAQNAKKN